MRFSSPLHTLRRFLTLQHLQLRRRRNASGLPNTESLELRVLPAIAVAVPPATEVDIPAEVTDVYAVPSDTNENPALDTDKVSLSAPLVQDTARVDQFYGQIGQYGTDQTLSNTASLFDGESIGTPQSTLQVSPSGPTFGAESQDDRMEFNALRPTGFRVVITQGSDQVKRAIVVPVYQSSDMSEDDSVDPNDEFSSGEQEFVTLQDPSTTSDSTSVSLTPDAETRNSATQVDNGAQSVTPDFDLLVTGIDDVDRVVE